MSTESRSPSNDLPDDSANATQASLRAGSLTGRRWCQWVGLRRPPQVLEGGYHRDHQLTLWRGPAARDRR